MNGPFKRRSDDQIVDTDAPSEDDATKLATEADTGIASPPADPLDDSRSDNGCATSTPQSPQRTEGGASSSSDAPTILIEGLWGGDETGQEDSTNFLRSQLTPTKGSNLGPPHEPAADLLQSHVKLVLDNRPGTFGLGRGV